MVQISDLVILDFSSRLTLLLVFLMPVASLLFGWFDKIVWLHVAIFAQFLVMVLYLFLLWIIVDAGRYPNSTGMEGIALLVVPFMFVGSMLVSYLGYFISYWIARRLRSA